jgi:N-acyl-D-aspartate/D-glutamate deacylase
MAMIVEQALRAGAVGFTTSRTILHSSKHGLVPGTEAPLDELYALADAVGAAGHGVLEIIDDAYATGGGHEQLLELAKRCGTVTYSLAQAAFAPDAYRQALEHASEDLAAGRHIAPQVSNRPTGMLFGLQSSLHPFITHPSYRAVAELPLDERVSRLRQREVRDRLLTEIPETRNAIAATLMTRFDQIFPLGDPPDYEPDPSTSIAAVAAATGRTPQEVALEWLLERDGTALLFAPLASYVDGDHEVIREMMSHPATVLGLSDGGAHCGLICDASMPTYLLTHWARDRDRGDRLPIEQVVRMQTGRTAELYGFSDRGTLEPGRRADVNVIDHTGLRLHAPEMVFDLPAAGRRLVQRVDGYVATLVAGEQTFAAGEPTGARPGRLVRGGPSEPMSQGSTLTTGITCG